MAEVTIVHNGGSESVEDFFFVEEVDSWLDDPELTSPTIRVWWEDPAYDDDAYSDFFNAVIVEVTP